jgi:hypothetical protein
MLLLRLLVCVAALVIGTEIGRQNQCVAQTDWAKSVELPAGEKPIELFNGKDLTGWEGNERHFSVVDGTIRAANEKGEVIRSGTYLFTKDSYRNFRLLLEVKQTVDGEHHHMHSAVGALGKVVSTKGNQFGFHGLLFMFCQDWGIWEAGGRKRVFPADQKEPIRNPPYDKIGDWNQIEILVVGNHVRMASNGQLVVDYVEKPSHLKSCPLGLQLHNNTRPQEFHFRGLVLVDSPVDELATVE